MKTSTTALLLALLISAVATAMFFWGGSTDKPAPLPSRPQASPNLPADANTAAQDERRLAALETSVKALQQAMAAQPAAGPDGNIERRLAALETSAKAMQQATAGVSLEKAYAERQALFAAEEGYLKVDEYAAAGQHAIAGEGYLTFLQHHPQHADARDVMKKARDSFLKVGYKDKAFWVHEEMMKSFPQHQSGDLWEQARLEKEAGLYDNAVNHAAQAAEMASNPEERLWRRLYWAWYVQLRDGTPTGIAALQQVQREIVTSGVTNPKLMENANRRMQEWQQQQVSSR